MVSRPKLGIVVERMTLDDLQAVQAIERDSFTTPWPPHAYRTEIETNRMAHYIVARRDSEIVGFAGMWLMLDEAHVTTIGVKPELRGQGLGELLFATLMEIALNVNARRVTLECRVSNHSAQALYRKYTFREEGIRRRYYSDNNEDALIMWSEALDSPHYRQRFQEIRENLGAKLGDQVAIRM